MSKLPSTSTSATIPAKKTNHYIDKAEMLAEVVKSKAAGAMTDKLARMILMLAEKYSHHHWFIGYSYREDMVADAVLNLVHSALKFDPEKSNNPFGYYTIAIQRSFMHYLHVEKKHRYIRDKMLLELGENPSFAFLEDHKAQVDGDPELARGMQELRDEIQRARTDPTAAPGEKKKKADAAVEDELGAEATPDLDDLDPETLAAVDAEIGTEFDEFVSSESLEDPTPPRRRRKKTNREEDLDINVDLLVYQQR